MEHGNIILNITQGVAYIMELQQNDLLFHFDDDPAEVTNCGVTGHPTFTPEEATQVKCRMDELFALDWGVFEDPHGFVVWVLSGEEHCLKTSWAVDRLSILLTALECFAHGEHPIEIGCFGRAEVDVPLTALGVGNHKLLRPADIRSCIDALGLTKEEQEELLER